MLIVALPQVDVLLKVVVPPPELVIVALPAVDVLLKVVVPPPELVIAALPAVDVLLKVVVPPVVLVIVTLPAVDALVKMVPSTAPELTIVCVVPELFVIPLPWIVSVNPFVWIVKALAPRSKLMPAAMMGLPSTMIPPAEPRKCATLPSVHPVNVFDVGEVLHGPPEPVDVVQVPPPAVAGVAASCQNRSTLQAFGSMLKVSSAAMNAGVMPRRFLIDWVTNLMRCVFMGMAIER